MVHRGLLFGKVAEAPSNTTNDRWDEPQLTEPASYEPTVGEMVTVPWLGEQR